MLLIVEILFIVLLSMILFMLYRNERLSAKRTISHARLEEYWGGRERRECVRFRQDLDVNYKFEKKAHLNNKGKTVDISQSGVKLLLEEKFAKGAILDLDIAVPGSRKSIEIEGEVVWSEEVAEQDASGKRLFHTGVRFLAIREPSGAQLANYIHSLCKEFEI